MSDHVELPPDVQEETPLVNCELPPDVPDELGADQADKTADAEGESHAEEVELPPEVPDGGPACLCRKNCPTKVNQKIVDNMRHSYSSIETESDRLAKLFQAIQLQICTPDGALKAGKATWTVNDQIVCRSFWQHCNYTGPSTLDSMKKLISAGHVYQPPKLPKLPKETIQRDKAGAFLLYLYTAIAQDYADDDDQALLHEPENELIQSSSHPLWTRGFVVAGSDTRTVPKKWLNPGTFESEIWQVYDALEHVEDKVSKSWMSE